MHEQQRPPRSQFDEFLNRSLNDPEVRRAYLAATDRAALPWAKWPWNQCRARVEPNPTGYYGRCELRRHAPDIDHALDRGMDIPRWSTRWTA